MDFAVSTGPGILLISPATVQYLALKQSNQGFDSYLELVFCRSRLLISAGGNHSATFFFLIGEMWQNSTSRADN
jgi:hypothetical protein